jgi:hypothetical protein
MNIIGMMVFCVLLVCLYTLWKVRKVHLLLYSLRDSSERDIGALYHQLEILLGLYVDLRLAKSLPGTRGWAASPDFLMELVSHTLREKPTIVVECSSGTSTVVLARCMQINGKGKVYSLEHDPIFAEQTKAQLVRHGLSEFAEVLVAPLESVKLGDEAWLWYAYQALPVSAPIDMLVIDGPPDTTGPIARYPAGPALFPRLALNAAVFLDDAKRDSEISILQRWSREFPHLIHGMAYCEKGCAVLRSATPV